MYRPEIDGLRAVAVLPVIFYHAGFRAFSGGYVGVDVFFVISGYLITRIIYKQVSDGNFSLSNFYMRRARRILPVLLVVMIACIPFARSWMLLDEFRVFSASVFTSNLFVSNFLFWKEIDYFAPEIDLNPLIHTWSLSIEEQFYLFFPLALLLLLRRSSRSLIPALAIVCAASFIAAEYASRNYPGANFYLIPFRAWELGAGALLALIAWNGAGTNAILRQIGSLLGLSLIAYAIFTLDDTTPFPSRWTLLPVLGAALIIQYADGSDLGSRLLSWKPLVFIGLISYSAYLWHQPILAFARMRSVEEPSTPIYLGLFVIILAVSAVTWRFVEVPVRAGKNMSPRLFLSVLIPVIVATSIFGFFGGRKATAAAFVSQASKDLATRLAPNRGLDNRCINRSSKCQTSDAPKVLIWGDSYAMHLVAGMIADNPKLEMIQRTMPVCGPFLDVAPVVSPKRMQNWAKTCIEQNKDVIDQIRELKSVRYAVLSSPFGHYVDEDAHVYYENKTIVPTLDEMVQRMMETIATLRTLGITTTVVSPPPRNGQNVGRCTARDILINGRYTHRCEIERSQHETYDARVMAFFSALERAGAHVVRLDDFLCSEKECLVYDDGKIIYRDHGHLSKEGSAWLGRKYGLDKLVTQP